jgi:hypothetical protein
VPKKSPADKKPRTKLRVQELLGDRSAVDLADAMGLKFYTQVYKYTKDEANPTLLMMEQLADGFSKILRKRVKVGDLIKE